MSEETSGNAPLNRSEAAAKISAALNPKKPSEAKTDKQGGKQAKPKAQPKAKPKASAPKEAPPENDEEQDDPLLAGMGQSDEGDDEADAQQGNPDDEGDQADEAQDADDSEGDEAEDEGESDLHTVVIDGKELEVSYEELVAGYQRQADYTRKMQSLANDRKKLEADKEAVKDLPKAQKAYQDGAQRFSKNAALVLAALEQKFMPALPSEDLKKSDPAAYIAAKEAHQEALQFVGALGGELQKIEQRQLADLQESIKQGRVKLFEMQPDLKDIANRNKLTEYAKSHGFTAQQIAMEPNPVLFQFAYKAMLYDQIMAKKAQLNSDKPKPKIVKQGRAPLDHKAVKDSNRAKSLDAHKAKGTVNSAADAIVAKLGARSR